MIQEQSQTHSAFVEAYQMSKLFQFADDDHWQELLNSPKNPVTIERKVKVKSISRMMTREEIKLAMKQFKSLNIKL